MLGTESNLSININLSVNTQDLVDTLSTNLNKKELFEFIKALDLRVAEWDFTVMLRDYFVDEMLKEENRAERE